jgi:hypothetical protein
MKTIKLYSIGLVAVARSEMNCRRESIKASTIIILGSILLVMLATFSTFAKPCECEDIDKIKAEIARVSLSEEAWKEIFGWARGMLPRVDGVKPPLSNDELNTKFLQLKNAPQSEWKRIVSEPVGKIEEIQKVGELDQNGDVIVNETFKQNNCDGIVEGIRVHESTHRNFFTSPFNMARGDLLTWRLLRTRAESEVESYRAQRIYLEALLASLEIRCDGELEYEAEITVNMQSMILMKVASTARISFKIDANKKITGTGTQTLSFGSSSDSACTASNTKSEYELIVSGQEEGGFLRFKFSPKGGATIPDMKCKIGDGEGDWVSIPIPFGIGDVQIEKKDGAKHEDDFAKMSGGMATGKSVITLHLYKK